MPTVMRVGPYGFVFFSVDRRESPHIHVRRDRRIAKFWLEPIRLAKNRKFSQHELTRIARLVVAHREELLDAWRDYFGA